MKTAIYILFTIFLTPIFCFAQQPNLEDSILYITPQEEAFMIDKETKYLFKIKPLKHFLRDQNPLSIFTFIFEQKLGNAFSISPLISLSINPFDDKEINRFRWGMEFRYYYKLPKLIKDQKQANNLSSNYFASSFRADYSIENNWINISNTLELTYGIQKRFLNYGYLDFRINLGVNRHRNEFYMSTGTNIGIALGKKYELTEETKCPIFKCFNNRKAALKISLNEIWSLSSFLRGHITLSLNPNIIHEVKIGKSPISFEQDLNTWIHFTNWQITNDGLEKNGFKINSFALRYRAGFKYYHSLKSRIRNGKSGNNLSGLYIFGRGEYKFVKLIIPELDGNGFIRGKKVKLKGQRVQLGYGYQKEVLENLFFDINVGFSKGVGKQENLEKKLALISDIKVGIMF